MRLLIITALMLLSNVGCVGTRPNESIEWLTVTNVDVTWDGTPAGVFPWLSDNAERSAAVLQRSRSDGTHESKVRQVKQLLTDPKRFVVAHVLLTMDSKEPFKASSREWNGLEVLIGDGDDKPRIDAKQRERIEAKWKGYQ